jgi:DnaJ-class molecular chaperone
MYDQVGYYSEKRYAGGGGHPAEVAAVRTWASAVSISPTCLHALVREPRAHDHRAGGRRGNFQDIFNQWFSRNEGTPQKTPQKGTDLEYGLNIDFWQPSGHPGSPECFASEACAACNGTEHARGERRMSGMQWQRERDAGGRLHALQSHLPALRR